MKMYRQTIFMNFKMLWNKCRNSFLCTYNERVTRRCSHSLMLMMMIIRPPLIHMYDLTLHRRLRRRAATQSAPPKRRDKVTVTLLLVLRLNHVGDWDGGYTAKEEKDIIHVQDEEELGDMVLWSWATRYDNRVNGWFTMSLYVGG